MSDTSGRSSRTPFASFAPDSSSSRTWQVMSLWGWTSYSGTWPRSGMTRGGDAYELPTLVPPTDGLESSSLLPTPTTAPTTGNGHARDLGGEVRLMPTPRTSDTNGAGEHGTVGPDLRTVVTLLPTPRATQGGSATETVALLPTPRATDGTKGGPNLSEITGLLTGVSTDQLSNGGSASPDATPLPPPNSDPRAGDDSQPGLWSG